jgi:hypothetical protein
MQKIEANNEVHRGLEGLCTWNTNWHLNKLHDLKEHAITIRDDSPDGYVLYGMPQRRAIWFPGHFEDSIDQKLVPRVRRLGYYHRNQIFVLLQTEILLEMIYNVIGFVKQNKVIPLRLQNLAKNAANVLGRLYGGRKTYRTFSSADEILFHKNAVNIVKAHFGKPDLFGEKDENENS